MLNLLVYTVTARSQILSLFIVTC